MQQPTLRLSEVERSLDKNFHVSDELLSELRKRLDQLREIVAVLDEAGAQACDVVRQVRQKMARASSWVLPWLTAVEAMAQADTSASCDQVQALAATLEARNTQLGDEALSVKLEFQTAFAAGGRISVESVRRLEGTLEGFSAWKVSQKSLMLAMSEVAREFQRRSSELRYHAEDLTEVFLRRSNHPHCCTAENDMVGKAWHSATPPELLVELAKKRPETMHELSGLLSLDSEGDSGHFFKSTSRVLSDQSALLDKFEAALLETRAALNRISRDEGAKEGGFPNGNESRECELLNDVKMARHDADQWLSCPGTDLRERAGVVLIQLLTLQARAAHLLLELPDPDDALRRSATDQQRMRLHESAAEFLASASHGVLSFEDFLRWFHRDYDDAWFAQNLPRIREGPFREAYESALQTSMRIAAGQTVLL